ncbi:MAG: ribosomal protein S18-alanine N-acetyltransferase [Eubacteriales bacterium]|nr:ribosomal protein S18-alanine N-acetyltransferase [Eubacteriales bacterium]
MPEIRRATIADAEEIAALEKASFTVPWSIRSIRYELSENPLAHLFIITENQAVLGYAGYHRIIDECEITNICVLASERQRGLGEALLRQLLLDARERGLIRASLEVRPSNLAALALYAKFGFRPIGLRHKYYPDNQEDALILGLALRAEGMLLAD